MPIYSSVEEQIGKTPLVRLTRLEEAVGCGAVLLAKIESQNPGGSAKDRVALSMIAQAEEAGRLLPGGVIVEPTSGNTGIGLSMIASVRGYRAVIVMPDTMSKERQMLMRAYGAEVVLTDGNEGMAGAIRVAKEIVNKTPNAVLMGQFTNEANRLAHYHTTGPEIYADCNGQIDCLVAGVGTGGTLSGAGRYFKERKPEIRIVAVEPEASPLLSKGYAGRHGIEGIGANFIPEILECDLIDEILAISDAESAAYARLLGKKEGLLTGFSGGAALAAAVLLGRREEYRGRVIVCVLPDGGERYLSTDLYSGETGE